MDKHLNCNQVLALMNFYIEGRLSEKLTEYVSLHLNECKSCKKKYEELLDIYNSYMNKKIPAATPKVQLPAKEFMDNLSAYVDNELNINDNIKIKKIAISNPLARKELESMYSFKKIMQMAYEKTRNESKYDCAKNIIAKVQETPEYSTSYFYKLVILFVLLIFSIIAGFVYLYM